MAKDKEKTRTITRSVKKDIGGIVTTGLFSSIVKDYHTPTPYDDEHSIFKRRRML